MTDINTVSLSGILNGDVETSKGKGVSVARFFIDVEGAGGQRPCGIFKIVAFAEWADVAMKLSKGDRVVLVGALLEWRGKGMRDVEIRVRNLIPLPEETPHSEIPEAEADEEEDEEVVEEEEADEDEVDEEDEN